MSVLNGKYSNISFCHDVDSVTSLSNSSHCDNDNDASQIADNLDLSSPLSISPLPRKHPCIRCGKCFKRSCALQRHVESVHFGLRPYKCVTCDKSYGDLRSLKDHQASAHSGKRDFQCIVHGCKKAFPHSKALRLHLKRFHTMALTYPCESCEKIFSKYLDLKTHQCPVSMKPIGYRCSLCDSVYTRMSTLKEHVASVHHGQKKFICEECSKAFGNSGSLWRHRRDVHGDFGNYYCMECFKCFVTASHLQRHVRRNHPLEAQLMEPPGIEIDAKKSKFVADTASIVGVNIFRTLRYCISSS